jgi:hypothetical protein
MDWRSYVHLSRRNHLCACTIIHIAGAEQLADWLQLCLHLMGFGLVNIVLAAIHVLKRCNRAKELTLRAMICFVCVG